MHPAPDDEDANSTLARLLASLAADLDARPSGAALPLPAVLVARLETLAAEIGGTDPDDARVGAVGP